MRNGWLRGEVRTLWEEAGRPFWDVDRIIIACEKGDYDLHKRGLTPAPNFREARLRRDTRYIRRWVLGCHFDWINPRRK